MNAIGRAHALLARHAPEFCLGALAGSDVQGKIRAALAAADPTRRRRESPLHPVLVFWLVLSLPLFRSLSVPNVFAHLMDAWRRALRGVPFKPVTDGALAHARERLGVAVPAAQGCRRRHLLPLYVRLMPDLGGCALERWRRPRRCPRAIKIKTLTYRHKQPGERSEPFDATAGLRLGVAQCA